MSIATLTVYIIDDHMHNNLQILKSRVDSFKPGRMIRSLRMKATLTRDLGVEVPACSYLVTLDGADEPNQMQIEIDAYLPSKERGRVTSVFTVPSVSQVPSSQAGTYSNTEPLLKTTPE